MPYAEVNPNCSAYGRSYPFRQCYKPSSVELDVQKSISTPSSVQWLGPQPSYTKSVKPQESFPETLAPFHQFNPFETHAIVCLMAKQEHQWDIDMLSKTFNEAVFRSKTELYVDRREISKMVDVIMLRPDFQEFRDMLDRHSAKRVTRKLYQRFERCEKLLRRRLERDMAKWFSQNGGPIAAGGHQYGVGYWANKSEAAVHLEDDKTRTSKLLPAAHRPMCVSLPRDARTRMYGSPRRSSVRAPEDFAAGDMFEIEPARVRRYSSRSTGVAIANMAWQCNIVAASGVRISSDDVQALQDDSSEAEPQAKRLAGLPTLQVSTMTSIQRLDGAVEMCFDERKVQSCV